MSRLSMRKMSEILRQRHALNQSYREIANSLNISISTVFDYIGRAKAAGLTWPLPDALTEENLYSMLFMSEATEADKGVKPDWKTIYKEYAALFLSSKIDQPTRHFILIMLSYPSLKIIPRAIKLCPINIPTKKVGKSLNKAIN
jgi:hypothetical protein